MGLHDGFAWLNAVGSSSVAPRRGSEAARYVVVGFVGQVDF
jgi:hypothetical protein